MQLDLDSIANPDVRAFYFLYWTQRRALRDFFELLPEAQYDYRMVDTPGRRADSPRESLVHLIRIQQIYLAAVKNGTLVFSPPQHGPTTLMSKAELLAAWEQVEQEMYHMLTADTFSNAAAVQVPWGESAPLDMLFFLRDHDILHLGWNLALLDHLDLPRYASFAEYWGAGDADAV